MCSEDDDEYLAKQAQKGDRDAFHKLYDLHVDRVYRRVRSRVPLQHAEDVTQEVFIAVIRSLPQFEQRSRFSTWLYTIVNRQIADFYRQRARYGEQQPVGLEDAQHLIADDMHHHSHGDETALVQRALTMLPEHYQEIILLRFADGLTFAEIAEQRGQSLEAVKLLYRRAIQAIREQIGVV
jgi:RNA polymerase sigma-70 factor (ECF subfamily)